MMMSSASVYDSSSGDSLEEIRRRKREMRKKIRSLLKELSDEEICVQSSRVWTRLFGLPAYRDAKSLGLFLSMPTGEIKTDQALNQILKDGKDLYVPRVGLCFEKCEMDFVKVCAGKEEAVDGVDGMFYDKWPRNKWAIPEPPKPGESHASKEIVAKPGDIDVLIVPGVAFDRRGNRLGQGKGYYDRFIRYMRGVDGGKVRLNCKPILVAVGLTPVYLGNGNESQQEQAVEALSVPNTDHDVAMDTMLFPGYTLHVQQNL